MDSFSSFQAEELKSRIPLIHEYFQTLCNTSCHAKQIKDYENNRFVELYNIIDQILNDYQRCKVGLLCRTFEELSNIFSIIYKSSLLEDQQKFHIKLQILPIFSLINQSIELP